MISSIIKNNNKRRLIIQGFILSVLLLILAAVLYRITFIHASQVDPLVYDVKIPIIDDKIPVIPIFFIGYNLSFIYWFFAPFYIVMSGKKNTLKFVLIFVVTLTICNLILYFYPTKLDRIAEGLFDPANNSFGYKLLHICYNVDGGVIEYNLLPSTHCANSVVYYQALKHKSIPKHIQNIALISTIIVSISTLFIKQHYFIDVVVGILIPIIVKLIIDIILRYKSNENH